MNGRGRAYLNLIRIPNVLTAAADVIAGYLYAAGDSHWPTLVSLCLASMCLYAGGATLNDILDLQRDRRDRPERPLPAGYISIRHASVLVIVTFAVATSVAVGVGGRAVWITPALVVAILLYNSVLKTTFAAPVMMGACRALNLLLGMHSVETITTTAMLLPVAVMGAYVTALTFFARTEARVSTRPRLLLGAIGVTVASLSTALLVLVSEELHVSFLIPVTLLGVVVGYVGARAVRSAQASVVQGAVGVMVLGIVGLDVCIVWAARGPALAGCVALVLPAAIALKRTYRVT